MGTPQRNSRDKRRWARWAAQVPLEVCSDLADRATPWQALMQNASEAGIAFWSKEEFAVGDVVYVREIDADKSIGWMPGRVVHSRHDLQGSSVGATFEHPGSLQFLWSLLGRSVRPATRQ
ncbi:MAG: PilZ domain-containing protein [Planctomycetota bacterium]